MVSFILISTLPILIVSIYSNIRYVRSVESKLGLYSEQILTEISKNIKNELGKYEILSEEVIMDDTVQDGLLRFNSMNDFDRNALLDSLNTKLGNEIFRFSNLKNIHLMMADGSSFFDIGYEFFNENRKHNILKEIDESPRNICYTHTKTNQDSDCIVIGRKINSRDNTDVKLGYMLIVVDEKVFAEQIYKNVDMGKGSDLFILDTTGTVISSISREMPNGSLFHDVNLLEELNRTAGQGAYTLSKKWKEGGYLAVSSYIPEAGWFLIGRIPDSYINSETSTIRWSVVWVCAVVIVISILLSLFIYLSVYAPIRELVQSARRIGDGDLEAEVDDRDTDEMGSLSGDIRRMAESLKEQFDNIKTEQAAKRDAELKMLQAQINPHFLFNTLNSLKWTAMLSNNNTLCEGLEALSGLMKDTILNKDELVELETELNNLNNYATIQRIRYGCSFSLVYDIPGELKKCYVLRFILQPIVENSIIHGIDDEDSQVMIKVTVERKDENLYITIEDDGKGFEPGQPGTERKNGRLSGIGITNVEERIKINYGAGYGLTVDSKPGAGTTVRISLPFMGERE